MEQEAPPPRLLTRDRAITLGTLAVLVGLSWVYLGRAPHHSPEMAPMAASSSDVAPSHAMGEESRSPATEEAEEDDVPRFH